MHTPWMKLLAVLSLSAALAACGNASDSKLTPVDAGDRQGSVARTTPVSDRDDRELTVVDGAKRPADQELSITNVHRIEHANIEAWLSEEEVRITTTTIIAPATDTAEPVVEHKRTIYNLRTGEHRPVPASDQGDSEWTYRETVSPDGKFMFIEQFKNKYEADNYMVNLETGKRMQVTGDYSMQNGGWLDTDTFVLSTNSPEHPAVVQIGTDGKTEPFPLGEQDGDTNLSNFAVAAGTIYYTDEAGVLKSFKPGDAKAAKLVEHAWVVSVSPDGERIAVTTNEAGKPSELLVFDTAGKQLGVPFAKGDLISYINWSPDSAKLAFAIYTEEASGMNGVYVMSSGTGKVTLVSPSVTPTYPLSWSPSGMRLGVTQEDTEIFDFE